MGQVVKDGGGSLNVKLYDSKQVTSYLCTRRYFPGGERWCTGNHLIALNRGQIAYDDAGFPFQLHHLRKTCSTKRHGIWDGDVPFDLFRINVMVAGGDSVGSNAGIIRC